MAVRYRPFNINNRVRVKLTPHGRAWIRRRHEEVYSDIPQISYDPPKEDVDGWSEWQLHDLMATFGGTVGMGLPVPFDMVVELGIEDDD